jgi:hypothetical protein
MMLSLSLHWQSRREAVNNGKLDRSLWIVSEYFARQNRLALHCYRWCLVSDKLDVSRNKPELNAPDLARNLLLEYYF